MRSRAPCAEFTASLLSHAVSHDGVLEMVVELQHLPSQTSWQISRQLDELEPWQDQLRRTLGRLEVDTRSCLLRSETSRNCSNSTGEALMSGARLSSTSGLAALLARGQRQPLATEAVVGQNVLEETWVELANLLNNQAASRSHALFELLGVHPPDVPSLFRIRQLRLDDSSGARSDVAVSGVSNRFVSVVIEVHLLGATEQVSKDRFTLASHVVVTLAALEAPQVIVSEWVLPAISPLQFEVRRLRPAAAYELTAYAENIAGSSERVPIRILVPPECDITLQAHVPEGHRDDDFGDPHAQALEKRDEVTSDTCENADCPEAADGTEAPASWEAEPQAAANHDVALVDVFSPTKPLKLGQLQQVPHSLVQAANIAGVSVDLGSTAPLDAEPLHEACNSNGGSGDVREPMARRREPMSPQTVGQLQEAGNSDCCFANASESLAPQEAELLQEESSSDGVPVHALGPRDAEQLQESQEATNVNALDTIAPPESEQLQEGIAASGTAAPCESELHEVSCVPPASSANLEAQVKPPRAGYTLICGFEVRIAQVPAVGQGADLNSLAMKVKVDTEEVANLSVQQSVRLLLGSNLDVSTAVRRASDVALWRRARKMDEVRRELLAQLRSGAEFVQLPYHDEVSKLAVVNPCALISADGCPVSVWHVGSADGRAHVPEDKLLAWSAAVFEYADLWISSLSEETRVLAGHIQVFNLQGLGLWQVSSSALIEKLKAAVSAGEFYLEVVSHIFVIHSSSLFSMAWKVVKGLVSPRTASKISVTADVPIELLNLLGPASAARLPTIVRDARHTIPVLRPPVPPREIRGEHTSAGEQLFATSHENHSP